MIVCVLTSVADAMSKNQTKAELHITCLYSVLKHLYISAQFMCTISRRKTQNIHFLHSYYRYRYIYTLNIFVNNQYVRYSTVLDIKMKSTKSNEL